MILNSNQVKQYLFNAGFRGSDLNRALLIANCESGFNTEAHNTNGEDSRGLMQINVSSEANPQYRYYNLFDPTVNTQVAYQIYLDRGKTFKDWTCNNLIPQNNDIFLGIGLALIIAITLYSI